ncbi:MAG TPA: hypothetical protein VL551_34430 [Actinospica sp.]|nr:hypothetical protein [Actinospica sp.]
MSDARPRPRRDQLRERGSTARRRALWIAVSAAVIAVTGGLAVASTGGSGYPSRSGVRSTLVRLVNQVLAEARQPGAHAATWDEGACGNADGAHGQLTLELYLDPVTPADAEAVLGAARNAWSADRYTVTTGRFETDPAYASAPDDQVIAISGSYRLLVTSVEDTSIWLSASSCYAQAAPVAASQTEATIPAPVPAAT